MTKDRACANSPSMSRRNLLTALPATGAALALPSATAARDDPAILEVLNELENCEVWEASGIAAAKAYAAYRMREALGLELPDQECPSRHLDFQRQSFEDYRRSILFEHDKAEGKVMTPPRESLAS